MPAAEDGRSRGQIRQNILCHKMVYEYKPLDTETNEIRLLRICNATDNASEESKIHVSCELTHHPIGPGFTHPDYSALSYVWGSLDDTVDILVHNRRTSVRRNLYEALKQLGSESCGFLWIDALCINQQDMKERQDQVLRMAEIYSGAGLVIAWLGIAQPDYVDVFGLIHRLWREVTDRWYTREELAGQRIENPKWVSSCQAMGRFCQLPYWRRTWIIQEVALARKLDFRSGPLRCAGDWLFNAVDVSPFGTYGTPRTENWEHVLTGDEYKAMETVRGLRNIKVSMEKGKQPLLYYLWMASLMCSESTDLRDRVYGLLGLAKDAVKLVPEPSYDPSNSLPVMLTEVTKSYVCRKGNFDILVCQNWNGRKDNTTPSWVPDYLDMSKSLPGHLAQLRQDLKHPFDCRTGFPKSVTNILYFDEDKLRFNALLWDTVLALGGVRDVQETEPSFVDIAKDPESLNLPSTAGNGAGVLPRTVEKPYSSEIDEYRAILAAIVRKSSKHESCDWVGTALCKMWDQPADFHKALLKNGDTHTVADAMAWLSQNSSFHIHGRSLRKWTEDHRDGGFDQGLGYIAPITDEKMAVHMRNLQRTLGANYYSRRQLVFTEQGFVGNVHGCTKGGDKIVIGGCNVPVILREKVGLESEFELVGDAYISGIMWGEMHETVAKLGEWKMIDII